MENPATLLLEPEKFEQTLASENVVLVDIGSPDSYVQGHIIRAIFLEYAWIVSSDPPRMGLLPSMKQIANVLGACGISPESHVIAYDNEGGGRACRLLWTLDIIGHKSFSLLNGGLNAWAAEGHPMTDEIRVPVPTKYPEPSMPLSDAGIADRNYVKECLRNEKTVILDARSSLEFQGKKVMARRGGHIPGAVNMEWTEAMDRSRNLRLKPQETLHTMLASLGVVREKEIIVHCHTHHRSAHTYIMLKSLGFDKVKGYPGSWSDWGNADDTPVE